MENTIQSQPANTLDRDSLYFAYLIVRDVSRTVRGIQVLVAALLQYVAVSLSIANTLMDLIAPFASNEN